MHKRFQVICDLGQIGPSVKSFDTLEELKKYFAGMEHLIDSITETKELTRKSIWPKKFFYD